MAISAPEPPARPPGRLHRLVRGPGDQPWWARPGLIAVTVLAGILYTWALDASGYGNEYYAAAARSGSLDWNAWLFGSFDTESFISVDKPPLSLWASGLSVRVFGLSPWSVLLPHAAAGVATVVVLHRTVRRWHGHAAALTSALFLTVTPVFVVMARYNNPDAILTLLITSSLALAYSAARSGSGWRLAGSGVLAGLAFLAKTTQALLVLPTIAVVYLVAAPVSIRKRVLHGAAAAGAWSVAAGWWILLAVTVPSAPFFGQTDGGGFLEYVFGYNGLGRVTGDGTGPGDPFGGGGGWSRVFNEEVGGQVSWLIPVAAVALLFGLWMRRGTDRTDSERAGWLMWGTFFVVQMVTFSLIQGVFHPYYVLTLAPPIAALAGAGAVEMWRHSSRTPAVAGLLSAAVVATGVWGAVLLSRTPDHASGLGTVILVLAVVVAVVLMVVRNPGVVGDRIRVGAMLLAGVVLLAGPVSFAAASIGTDYSGGDPKAGPGETGRPVAAGPTATGDDDRPAPYSGYPPLYDDRPVPSGTAQPADDRPPRPDYPIAPVDDDHPPGRGLPPNDLGTADMAGLIEYLLEHRGDETWMVATVGTRMAAPLILKTGEAVMAMGGFSGGDPVPSAGELVGYIETGALRFVLLTEGNRSAETWSRVVANECSRVTGDDHGSVGDAVLYDCAPSGI